MSTPKAHETDIGEFNAFINTMTALQAIGGNCHFEWRLYKAIERTGKHIGTLTVAEFLAINDQVNADYNEFMERLQHKTDVKDCN